MADALLFMPVLINAAFFVSFAVTLWKPPSMAERFAMLTHDVITPEIAAYCKKVTVVWIVFFIFNGAVSFFTVISGIREYWVLYNGLISYVLMGLLFGIEWIVRQRVEKKNG
jgi:uncharacterized membrane protein